MDKKKIIASLAGIFCAYMAFAAISGVSGGIAAIAGLIISLVWGVFAVLCFYIAFGSRIGMFVGNTFYAPLEYLKNPAERISRIRGLVEQEKYQEAIDALNEILARRPYDPLPNLLLVEVYMDRLNDKEQSAGLIEKYFQNPKLKVSPENVELLMRYSDICLEQKHPEPAIALFQNELSRKEYSDTDRRTLTLRLEALMKVES